VLLVYDVTDRDSFQWLSKWRDQVAEYVGDINSVVIAVVGNKVEHGRRSRICQESWFTLVFRDECKDRESHLVFAFRTKTTNQYVTHY